MLVGYYTGSLYTDTVLMKGGLLGENVKDGRAIAIKSHEVKNKHNFRKVILLIRNPYDTIVAEFNRRLGGHTKRISQDMFSQRSKLCTLQ